jgi:uncharacterized repeat protein (TIGR01451 family)
VVFSRARHTLIACNAATAAAWLLAVWALLAAASVQAAPVSTNTLARLAAGQSTWVVVEFDGDAIELQAGRERLRRRLPHDDEVIGQLRRDAYRTLKAPLERVTAGPDFTHLMDYSHLPLAAWELRSLAALRRVQSLPGVRAVHENTALRPSSVSDLGLISQPAAIATGAIGAGTSIAVIDGGLDLNYLSASDFGPCTDIATPTATCRVVLNRVTYPGQSTVASHGTNVAAIALGTAPGAKLAMFDVFNGSSASVADIINAMNYVVANRSTYNFVAINLSLGDAGSNSSNCYASSFYSAVTTARSAGIAVVVAAGNSGSKTGVSDPACVPGAISVGAVYDNDYGAKGWNLSGGGTCTDSTTNADRVTCFSQSASFLSLLAPGTFVAAPNSTLVKSGTSQATPHVSGAVAILRSRYPTESVSSTLQRLQLSGNSVTDTLASSRITPRLNIAAAVQLGTNLILTGSGDSVAVNGGTSSYLLTVSNSGPLLANNVKIALQMPAGASLQSASSGCALSGSIVSCSASTLAVNASQTFTVILRWSIDGPVTVSASVSADQINSAAAAQQQLTFAETNEAGNGDAPLPLWSWCLLAAALLWLAQRQVRTQEQQ